MSEQVECPQKTIPRDLTSDTLVCDQLSQG